MKQLIRKTKSIMEEFKAYVKEHRETFKRGAFHYMVLVAITTAIVIIVADKEGSSLLDSLLFLWSSLFVASFIPLFLSIWYFSGYLSLKGKQQKINALKEKIKEIIASGQDSIVIGKRGDRWALVRYPYEIITTDKDSVYLASCMDRDKLVGLADDSIIFVFVGETQEPLIYDNIMLPEKLPILERDNGDRYLLLGELKAGEVTDVILKRVFIGTTEDIYNGKENLYVDIVRLANEKELLIPLKLCQKIVKAETGTVCSH